MKKRVTGLAILTIIFLFTLNMSVQANLSRTVPMAEHTHTKGLQPQSKEQHVNRIAHAGYELGKSGAEYKLPTKFERSEKVFKTSYKKGYQEYKLRKESNLKIANIGAGLLFFVWLCRRFYVARKMIS
ncbi:hypothetical protein [Bacillus marasmi]|uniref:hypothetical protein n=1 Tax=Bacillus marasmi TaxID=1926279 RepID=UPI0011C80BE9|nr:hypothetical protein [Bacillus marasmi]